jgi:hypothetical protein
MVANVGLRTKNILTESPRDTQFYCPLVLIHSRSHEMHGSSRLFLSLLLSSWSFNCMQEMELEAGDTATTTSTAMMFGRSSCLLVPHVKSINDALRVCCAARCFFCMLVVVSSLVSVLLAVQELQDLRSQFNEAAGCY